MNQPVSPSARPAGPSSSPKLPRKKSLQNVSDGRRAALEVVLLLEQGAHVQAALDSYLRGASLKVQDRALCTELVYGFLRAEVRIDYILQSLLRNPRKLPREMYLALGLAVYALVFLERIPVHATVDWTVGHVRRRFGEPMSRVANGALRALVRQGDAPKNLAYYLPQAMSSPTAFLQRDALFYAVPLWIAQLWQQAYGAETTTALLQRSFAAPHSCVRINARSVRAGELRAALLPALAPPAPQACSRDESCAAVPPPFPRAEAVGPWGVAFAAGTSPRSVANAPLSYWQQQGDISFQSAGSQSAMAALEPDTWPQPVWDMCVGQGGKSCLLLEQGASLALCTDVHLPRLESFTGNIQRITSAFSSTGAGAVSKEAAFAAQLQAKQVIVALQHRMDEKIYILEAKASAPSRTLRHADADVDEEMAKCSVDSVSTVDGAESFSSSPVIPLIALVDGTQIPQKVWKGTILIDAPCSGLGVLSRRPDIRRSRREQSLAEMIALQAQLLESAWQALQAGGALVYMTCTLNPAENENQIHALAQKYPELQIIREWQSTHTHPWLEGMYAAYCVKAV